MAEVDYQTALLLQYKFEQEFKRKENTDSDYHLALELQEQFKAEFEVERPKNNLVYKTPPVNNSKCLVDPSWEVIDPTPDIYVLFMAFNERFFWNQLQAVTVSWSKRMTSCAGVCSYQGRGGLCSITLSEPLLKLRPRKDLVETLLHEMIHAYLFITNNNRDRDGHGPEFQKHMYRINSEAGTNITIYHDFHDEVKLYQQHWWRCDGPCQNLKPYFGIIRRATNRAPSSNDRWWGEHSRNCGGTFIKVKEPKKLNVKEMKVLDELKNGKPTFNKTDPKNDIRRYIPALSKTLNNTTSSTENKENVTKINTKTNITILNNIESNGPTDSNIHTVSNSTNSTPQISNLIPSKSSNIFGFTDLNGTSSNNPQRKPGGRSTNFRGAVKNAGGSTFVITKKGTASTSNQNSVDSSMIRSNRTSNIPPFSGTGRTLGAGGNSSLNNYDYSVVRDHWVKKFKNDGGVKRPHTDVQTVSSQKIPRIAASSCTVSKCSEKVECPVCNKELGVEELNTHLDSCLQSQENDYKQCFICGNEIKIREFDRHVNKCSEKNFGDAFEDHNTASKVCPFCQNNIDAKFYDSHIEKCPKDNFIDLTQLNSEGKNCPICKALLSHDGYDCHVERCLLKMYDKLEDKYDLDKDKETSCLACKRQILKSELDAHLEECMSMSNVFDTTNVPVEDDIENRDDNIGKKDRYNCPFCLKLVLENDMQWHLDECLKIADCGSNSKGKEYFGWFSV